MPFSLVVIPSVATVVGSGGRTKRVYRRRFECFEITGPNEERYQNWSFGSGLRLDCCVNKEFKRESGWTDSLESRRTTVYRAAQNRNEHTYLAQGIPWSRRWFPQGEARHCTPAMLTLAITPNVGNSSAQFLVAGDCVRAFPFTFSRSCKHAFFASS